MPEVIEEEKLLKVDDINTPDIWEGEQNTLEHQEWKKRKEEKEKAKNLEQTALDDAGVINKNLDLLLKVDNKETGKSEINQSFFNQEDEDAVPLLRAQFGDNFNFEQSSMLGIVGDKTAGGVASFSAVKISTKDGKHSKTIELNIDGRGSTDDLRTQKALAKYELDPDSLNSFEMTLVMKSKNKDKAYQQSYNDLVSFINKHSTSETAKDIGKKEKQIKEDYKKFNEETKVDVAPIAAKYSKQSQPDLFKKVDKKSDAEAELKREFALSEAVSIVRDKEINDLLPIAMYFKVDINKPVSEIRYDLLNIAKKKTKEFMEAFDSPQVQVRSTIQQAADYQIIKIKQDGCYWFDANTLIVANPVGQNTIDTMVRFCLTEKGASVLSSLEERLDKLA